jgi:hypothetical protein
MNPEFVHPPQHVLLRSRARFGLITGLKVEGAFGRPASIAASASVSSPSGLPK